MSGSFRGSSMFLCLRASMCASSGFKRLSGLLRLYPQQAEQGSRCLCILQRPHEKSPGLCILQRPHEKREYPATLT